MRSILLTALLAAKTPRGFAENAGQPSVEASVERLWQRLWRRLQNDDAFTDATIYDAVDAWLDDATAAEAMYGHISTWDVKAVTNMAALFCAQNCPTHNHFGAASTKTSRPGTRGGRAAGHSFQPTDRRIPLK